MFSKTTKRVIAWVCMMAMVLGMMVTNAGAVYAAEVETSTEAAGEHTMWVVGDSTVCAFDDPYYYPRYGYGTQIGNYLDGTYTVQNLAMSGRSSLSFLGEANYQTLKTGMKSGDVLVIGFGHNDEKTEADRYTNPNGDYTIAGSFEYVLYENYVKPAMDAGVEVILCTPIVRYDSSNSYTGAKAHVTSTTTVEGVTYEGGDYSQAIRDLGAAFNLTVVDLTELTKAEWKAAGADEAVYYHAWTNSKVGSMDGTHINIYGAKKVAYMFAEAVSASSSSVASHVVLGTAPTKANDLVVNPSYVEKPYSNDLAQSELWADYGIFKGTAFGYLGGTPSTKYYTMEADGAGNMHIVASKDNKGKITGGGDGIVMYYYKVPVGTNFSLKATATLNEYGTNDKQVAFGLMARDDMYIDVKDSSILSDYVAAASSPDGEGGGFNCFYRKNGTLNRSVPLTVETLAVGKSYELSIVSNDDGYACTFGNEPTQTGGYDFQLTSVDSDYVYIGMFVARYADVTYSDIELIVGGQQIDIMTGEVIGGGSTGGEDPIEPEDPVIPTNTVEDFVKRMYTVALGRDAEEEGVTNWVAALNAGTHDGAKIAKEFILGEEFTLRNLTDEQFLDTLYQTFFGREADAEGKAFWLSVLQSGQTREFVLSNFVNLPEFTMLCGTYGIERGVMLESGAAVNPGVPKFVKRMYTIALGRDAENDGLYNNVLALVVGAVTAEDVAKNFFTSEEYTMKGKDDAAYVTDLYAAFMGREADESGLKFWTDTIAVGMTRDEVLSEFAKSAEFKAIAASYGL